MAKETVASETKGKVETSATPKDAVDAYMSDLSSVEDTVETDEEESSPAEEEAEDSGEGESDFDCMRFPGCCGRVAQC
jgi:hypothetical protein